MNNFIGFRSRSIKHYKIILYIKGFLKAYIFSIHLSVIMNEISYDDYLYSYLIIKRFDLKTFNL